jgi:hypothetical protein
MRTVCFVFCALICSAVASSATETSSDPVHPAMDSSGPALPDSDPSSPGVPDLLPESSAIPSQKSREARIKAASADRSKSTIEPRKKQSKRSVEQAQNHLEKIRSLAKESPRAEYLLDRARHASTRTARRRYLRRYDAFVQSRMKILDPDPKVSTIDPDREQGSDTRTSKSKVHKAHHRSHSYAHHTNRRHRIYFDEYGPPEMGPYGPPPYGPPGWWPPPPGGY